MSKYVLQKDHTPSGKKASQVANLMEALVAADGEPRPYEELCEEVGIKYPGDLKPAMDALEIAGAIDRFTFTDTGTKNHVAYALSKEGGTGPSGAA